MFELCVSKIVDGRRSRRVIVVYLSLHGEESSADGLQVPVRSEGIRPSPVELRRGYNLKRAPHRDCAARAKISPKVTPRRG